MNFPVAVIRDGVFESSHVEFRFHQKIVDDPHPFLSVFHGKDLEKRYLRFWYDREDGFDTYLLVEVPLSTATALLNRELGMRSAGLAGSRAWLYRVPEDAEHKSTLLIWGSACLDWGKYLPNDAILNSEDLENAES
jgi:hypothetical protein